MSFQYKSGQVSFEDAYEYQSDKSFFELLGKLPENRILIKQIGILAKDTYGIVIKYIYEPCVDIKSETLCLQDIYECSLDELSSLPNITKDGIEMLYTLYATHASPYGENIELDILKEYTRNVKEFCIFKIDGITYLKLSIFIIPFASVVEINDLVDEKVLDFEFTFIASACIHHNGVEYKKGDSVLISISNEDIDPIEVRKLIAIFNNFTL